MEFKDCPSSFTVNYSDRQTVEKNCDFAPGKTTFDNGTVAGFKDSLCGCWIEAKKTIWLTWGCMKSLWHELAHACGVDDPRSEGYDL